MKVRNNFIFFEVLIIFLSVILIVSYKPTLLEMFSEKGGMDLIFYQIKNCISQGINHYRSICNDNINSNSHGGTYLQIIYLILYPFNFFDVNQIGRAHV